MKKIQQRFLLLVVLVFSAVAHPMNQSKEERKEERKEELALLRETYALLRAEEGECQTGARLPEGPLRAYFKNVDLQWAAYSGNQNFYNHGHMQKNKQALSKRLKKSLSLPQESYCQDGEGFPRSKPIVIRSNRAHSE